MNRQTIFSPCRMYRYTLWREFDVSQALDGSNDGERGEAKLRGYVTFVGLNPSTADETTNDRTIRRCMGFARDWGFGALCMINLFGWRATLPKNMKRQADPVGIDNDVHLERVCKDAGLIVAAWGKDGKHLYRDVKFKLWAKKMGLSVKCLGLNLDGTPVHPLYQPADAELINFL